MRKLLLSVMALALSGCATTEVKKERLAGIKSVALVGFSVVQQMPKKFEIGGSTRDSRFPGMDPDSYKVTDSAHVLDMYGSLQNTLHKAFKWKVMDRTTLMKNEAYAALLKDTRTGFQNRVSAGEGRQTFLAEGVVEAFPIERLDDAERKTLLEKLKVDAIAIVRIRVDLEEGGGLGLVVGVGEYRPRATVEFKLFDRNVGDPVWREAGATGAVAKEGVGHVLGMGSAIEALNKKAVEAASSAYGKMLEKYRSL